MSEFHSMVWQTTPAVLRLADAAAVKNDKLDWHAPALSVLENFTISRPLVMKGSLRLPDVEEAFASSSARYACVIDNDDAVIGVLLARDLHSRQSGALSNLLQLPWGQLEARFLMQPLQRMPTLTMAQIERARIGDIAATMQAASRDFVIVTEQDRVIGLVAALKILERTGESVRLYPRATTFAEVFSALKHPEITDS
ncbi:hypothetical protein [Pseudidiomarina terrestris]|uniref:CBS domain-containing protein n=1 Tax=Pseudidiomarina terrestris TaxID=2820060 RepID=A0AAW7QYA6_9GAMM|nr:MULTISPECIES: hypothetical protein [unclassified Pseudidiomarina]MDN7123722.1 hypothetical protein [Pseudidiomarina sp. 1APP75-32.1]MDN7126488.1 hypothetical protein [Pseudidiomarina sp. 1APR75-33.1]MDN7128554.1 hypothetical protein [Pseudidiomarina sp. 1APR75-15]MDN7135188.1 hypothetical protein [Pseudidiomarina sp. 1ASP75-5]